MSFDSLGLSPDILRAVAEQGYREPTPIQQQAIPAVLEGRDLMASAQTGTGKTAGFTLPLLQHLISREPHAKGRRPVRALILTPTRELAAQIGENVRDYSKYLNIRSLVVFGGVSINPQMMKLRGGVDVLVATPGRLLDLEHQNAVKLDQIEILVLDEADRMLDMGFIHDIRRVLTKLPAKRQNLLFSATFSDEIKALAEKLAACATLIPGATSLYYWEGKLEQEYEVQMILKTDKAHQQALLECLKAHHPYQTPELLVLPVTHGDTDYLSWLNASLR